MPTLLEALMGRPEPEQAEDVTVQAGDTLSKIARRHGTTVDDLIRINGIADANVIRVGQNIVVSEELQSAGFSFGKAFSNLVDKIPNVMPVQRSSYLRYVLGSNSAIERDDFSPEAIEELRKFARQGGVNYYGRFQDEGGGFNSGRVVDAESSNEAIDEIAYTLGRFGTTTLPDGSIRIDDTYDFHGTEKQSNLEIAKTRWEQGHRKAAALSIAQALAPRIRKILQMATFRERNDKMPVDIVFSPEELRQ